LRDAGSATHAAASEWLQRGPDASLRLRGDAENAFAWGCKSIGELDAGFAAVARARDILSRDRSYHGLAWSAIIDALLALKGGDFPGARASCERGLGVVREQPNGHRG